jgi:L-2-hydroxyglutarate oxidase LhgO
MANLPAKNNTSAPATLQRPLTTVEVLDQRIAAAQSPQELAILVGARREVLRQDEEVAEGAHRRRTERLGQIANILTSIGAIGAGATLVLTGHPIEGRICLGAGLYFIAPELMKMIFGVRGLGDKDAS